MRYYHVDGYDHPLLLSEAHADLLGATEVGTSTKPPARSASKAEWIDYAITQGADPLLADTATRAELIELYGGG